MSEQNEWSEKQKKQIFKWIEEKWKIQPDRKSSAMRAV